MHVVFFSDGEIQMDCGQEDHGTSESYYRSYVPVGLNHLIDKDNTILELFPEKQGYSFGRKNILEKWIKYTISEND
jgi:hypothetical protein